MASVPYSAWASRHGLQRRVQPLVGLAHLVGVDAHVEPRHVEPEEVDARQEVGEPAVGDARAGVRPQGAVDHAQVGEQLRRVAVARRVAAGELVVEPLPDRRELAPVGLRRVAPARLLAEALQLLLVAGERGQQRRVGADEGVARRPARGPARAPRRGRRAAPGCGRARGRRAARPRSRSGCRPGRRRSRCRSAAGRGRSGSSCCQRRASSAPAPKRLDSKNQRPVRTSSETVGRNERTSSVCHSIVVSSASARSTAARSPGSSAGRRGRRSSRPSRTWLCRNVRRAASVGWAVSTGSSRTPAARSRSSASPMPAARMAANEASSVSGRGPSSPARRRSRRMRWYCSARFASTK